MPLYDKAARRKRRVRGRRAQRARGDSGEPVLHLPHGEGAGAARSPAATYRVADVDLASRLSFFLWGTPPDQELLALASKGALSVPATLEKQTRRMLADPRADALGTRFAAQWLRLQDVDKVHPDPNNYPNFDDNLAAAMRRETELFFNSLVREDRSVLDLYRAELHLRERSAGAPLRLPRRLGQRVPPRRVSRRHAPRPARAGQRPGADLARQPHVAGAARQVGDGSADGHAAAAAAARRADARRDRRREGRQDADDARADGDAPGEPDVHVVPSLHGSDRPGARQLRRDRQVARARERHAARHARRLLRRHAGDAGRRS